MIIELKRQVEYPDVVNGVLAKRVLKIGRHTVDDESINHWFVQGLIKSNDIILLGSKSPAPIKLDYSHNPSRVAVPKQEVVTTQVQTITVSGVKPLYSEPVIEKEVEKAVEAPPIVEKEVVAPKRRTVVSKRK
jgi:hypothetical protein